MRGIDPNGFMPQARNADLHEQELNGEILVYDRRADTAHCLSPQIARIWRACDGETTVEAAAAALGMPVDDLGDSLAELGSKHLLESIIDHGAVTGLSRRGFIVRTAATAAAGTAILSVAAPVASAALSPCSNVGGPCNSKADCCNAAASCVGPTNPKICSA